MIQVRIVVEWLVFGPFFLLVLIGAILFLRARFGYRAGYYLSLGGVGLVVVLASFPFQSLIGLPLSLWVPGDSGERAGAIVVLGAGTTPAGAPNGGASERAHTGAQLFLAGRAPVMLMTGANWADSLGGARAMRLIALGMGVPESQILMASGLNTYEEGVSARRILGERGVNRVLLVTHRLHIPRASAVFRTQGFSVISYAVPEFFWWGEVLSWHNVERVRVICHEYLGMLVYRLRGWIR